MQKVTICYDFNFTDSSEEAETARPSKTTCEKINEAQKMWPHEAVHEAAGDFKLKTSRLNVLLQIGVSIFVTSLIFL